MSILAYPHIEIAPNGMAMISGTTTKVVEVVLDRLAYHWDADEIHRQHPHLSLGQIYSALAYYYDHEQEMNDLIEKREQEARKILSEFGDSRVRAKLQAIKARGRA